MTLSVPAVLGIYFLIGLFIGGVVWAFDDDPGILGLVVIAWPVVLGTLAVIFIVAIPVMIGKWIGDVVKGWL